MLLWLTAAGGALVAVGSRRTPADATQPLVFAGSGRLEAADRPLRLATFNIRGGRGRDDRRDLERTARSLGQLDLVALQEVYGATFPWQTAQTRTLGKRLDMASLFVPTERRWGNNHSGIGLLTRSPIHSALRIPLPGTQNCRFRTALLVVLPYRQQRVNILMVHLDDRQDRERQWQSLTSLFFALEEPAVLMGDLNRLPADPELKSLIASPGVTAIVGENLSGQRTLRGVDWIIARGLYCVTSESRDCGASDHAVVCADLDLRRDWRAMNPSRSPR